VAWRADLLCAAVWLFSLIVYITINQLPFGHEDAWRWYVGEAPWGVAEAEGSPSGLGLDPSALQEWFGGLYVTSGFHDPSRPHHNGIDFSMRVGTPIRSTWRGQVTYAGWSNAGYGNLIVVQNGDYQMYYGHMSSIGVSVGQQVNTGTTLGLSGNTGVSTGPHLHYEVRYQGTPIDPVSAPTGEPIDSSSGE
jgi:murein DD-endopeptidase MepM/ murein hydrolase activator NlpD